MSRPLLFLLCFAGLTVSATAQTVSATRVYTEPAGSKFYVDGVPYLSAQTFFWTEGSKHTLMVDGIAQQDNYGTRTRFTGWTDSTGNLANSAEQITITATPSVTFVKATLQTEVRLQVLFYQCTGSDGCNPPGRVMVGGAPFDSDAERWVVPGSSIVLQAFPNPGFVFNGWGPPSNYNMNFIYTHVVRGPTTFAAIFAAAKQVTLLTEPANLMVAPDRGPVRAPVTVDWGMNSKHVLGVVTPQASEKDANLLYVFKGWSNGAANLDTYTVTNTNIPDTLTAQFVPGARVSFVTNPVGLKLKVEGRENWPAYNFVWGQGMKYQVSAPPDQVDSRGRRYVFKGWSNGGTATQDITITAADVSNGFRIVANYEAQNRVTISSVPAGMPVTVDGQECRVDCVYDRSEGAVLQIAAPKDIPISDNSRLQFVGWSDGGPATRTITIGGNDSTLVVEYRFWYKLTATAEPGNGASFQVDPLSPDSFYEAGTVVTLTAEARPGYRFRRWEGDLTGTFKSGFVTMNVPRLTRALFDIAPYADEKGVRNAAAETPEPVVAAGSLATILGANLAGSIETGPANPLSQTVGNVAVRIGSRFVSLLSVAPEQLNLVVPVDIPEGDYTALVKWENYPEVATTMRVVRNAPGLFQKKSADKMYASAARENGDEISPESPAQRGDTVTLFGTGFGPYDRRPVEGFPLPANLVYTLQDTVELLVGETPVDVIWAGGAAGKVGTSAVRFKLPQDVEPADGAVVVRVRINGRESNRVFLPVQ
ncbi:MAG: hypothetical protein HY820_01325 [Acidobacteria bacterium]|nr:hypothetical protein [Acidobacteriota bacterium]